jgi:hypothetical protein
MRTRQPQNHNPQYTRRARIDAHLESAESQFAVTRRVRIHAHRESAESQLAAHPQGTH